MDEAQDSRSADHKNISRTLNNSAKDHFGQSRHGRGCEDHRYGTYGESSTDTATGRPALHDTASKQGQNSSYRNRHHRGNGARKSEPAGTKYDEQ